MSGLRVALSQAVFKRLARKMQESLHDPRPAQEAALQRLVRQFGGTVVGQRFGLARVTGLESARRLPVTDYPAYESYGRACVAYGQDAVGIFSRKPMLAIIQSSGSVGDPKRLPITAEYAAAYRRYTMTLNATFLAASGRWDSVSDGKTILLSGAPVLGITAGGLPEGYVSGFMASRVPFLFRSRLLPSRKTLFISDWSQKLDAIYEEAKARKVRALVGIPAMLLTFIERVLERSGKRNLRELWPEFAGVLYSGTGISEASRKRFDQLCGAEADPLVYWEMYAATEAQIGHTIAVDVPGMVFNPFENFYQFLEEGDTKPCHLHELVPGRRYLILLTTPGGLVNYRVGDWIECLSVKPLTFRVSGRDREEISFATEKLNVSQFRDAMTDVSRETGLHLDDFCFWGVEGRDGRAHTLVCALFTDQKPLPPDLSERIDRAVGAKNSVYKFARFGSRIFGPLELRVLPSRVAQAYRARNLHRGQFKPKQIVAGEAAFAKEYGPLA